MYFSEVKLKPLKRAPILIAASVIGLACVVQTIRFEFFERLEGMTYDWRVRQSLSFSPLIATNLGFVDISDRSIERLNNGSLGFRRYGSYWPRHIYGRVARELSTQGAKAVAFDILFGEVHPDDAPVLLIGQEQPVESDEYFARMIRNAGNVLIASEQGITPPALFRTNALGLGDITADKDFDGVLRRAKAFRTYRKWHQIFQKLADDPDLGVNLQKARVEPGVVILPRPEGDPIKVPVDGDGRFDVADFLGDKVPAGMERHPKAFTDERAWHMGIVLAAQELKLDLSKTQVELARGRIILRGPGGLERIIPVDTEGYFYINWRLTANNPHLTQAHFEDLLRQDQLRLKGETNGLENRLQGKLVIIGSAATGNDLTDRGATPLEKDTLLVSKHWNVANSVLTDRFIRRAGVPVELLLISLLGLIAAGLTWTCRVLVASSWVMVVLVGYLALAVGVFAGFGYWLPLVLPVTGGLLVTHACLLGYLVVFEQAEQRRVRSVFAKVVSPNVVHELLRLEKLPLGGTRRNVTAFFADIRGFTEMTDVNLEKAAAYDKQHNLIGEAAEAYHEQQARETLATVNLYLSVIAEQVIRHDGTIDKFIGDCVMAFWGAPMPNPRHALFCVRAAIDAQQAVYRLNQERAAENQRRDEENLRLATAGQPPLPSLSILSVGSGINTGVVTVGLMGSAAHGQNYTVFGRDVNLAQRLESVSGRGRIIISEATLAEIIQDDPSLALSCVELPRVNVKGIRDAVRIYEVPWRTGEFAFAGETPTPISAGDTMPPFPIAGHDTSHLKATEEPRV
ncbi:MAG: Adenylate/guanylate cyclase [Pedosphaera sp.]|nr:Adenylate/guanylate cyclase [Pedosphaera sp.]